MYLTPASLAASAVAMAKDNRFSIPPGVTIKRTPCDTYETVLLSEDS